VISILHFWPPQGSPLPAIACGADDGVRSSHIGSVTCSGCVAAVALDERRQRAREVFLDEIAPGSQYARNAARAIDEAIETATRVRVTREVEDAAEAAAGDTIHDYDGAEMRRIIEAAFRAAGFEVEQ
jgi:hypothetical protein